MRLKSAEGRAERGEKNFIAKTAESPEFCIPTSMERVLASWLSRRVSLPKRKPRANPESICRFTPIKRLKLVSRSFSLFTAKMTEIIKAMANTAT